MAAERAVLKKRRGARLFRQATRDRHAWLSIAHATPGTPRRVAQAQLLCAPAKARSGQVRFSDPARHAAASALQPRRDRCSNWLHQALTHADSG